jgi:hypothetical protein
LLLVAKQAAMSSLDMGKVKEKEQRLKYKAGQWLEIQTKGRRVTHVNIPSTMT